MQNWLASSEPALFFGVTPPAKDRPASADEPFGKIVFAQRLEEGDRVRVARSNDGTSSVMEDGEVVGMRHEADTPVYAVRLLETQALEDFRLAQLRRTAEIGTQSHCFECRLRWKPRLAGRMWELPARGVCRSGDVLIMDEPIRFECPEEPPDGGSFAVAAKIACRALEISFTHLMVAPWSAAKAHWMADGGLVAPHHQPLMSQEYTDHAPRHGTKRVETSHPLPEQFARLLRTPRLPQRLIQSEDGTVTQTCQCSPGDFDAARSTHRIEAEYRRTDTFTFTILRCANERAAGIRFGVCSDDGSEAWMLRVSDARLCGASGQPFPGMRSLFEDLPRFLPPDMMGFSISIKVDMTPHGTSTLSFRVAEIGSFFSATRDLPSTVRPCVHLTHKGDAVRLQDHACMRLRDPASLGRPATPPPVNGSPVSHFMTGVAAYNRGRPPSPQRAFLRSQRTLRPGSPTPTPSTPPATPRARTPRTRRAPAPELLGVVSPAGTDATSPTSPTSPASPANYDPRCAKCRQNTRAIGKPWCVKCAPIARDDATPVHESWSLTGGNAASIA